MPTDHVVAVEADFRLLAVKLWRYVCPNCDWWWANFLQRRHNDREVTRARKKAQMPS